MDTRRGLPRTGAYYEGTNKIGKSSDNIKTFKSFVSAEDSKLIVESVDFLLPDGPDVDPDDRRQIQVDDLPDNVRSIVKYYIDKSLQTMQDQYGVKLEHSLDDHWIVKWSVGNDMGVHADDDVVSVLQVSGVIYFSDGYGGGEITFPNQNISIKPEMGDLVIFPGNLTYPHGVNAIEYGHRYSLPLWGKYVK
jgi:hypothetical protein